MKQRAWWTLALILLLVAPGAANGAPLSSEAAGAVRSALGALEVGNRAAFVSAFAPDATILDEISPFYFSGAGAASHWFDRLRAVNDDNAIADEHTQLLTIRTGSVEGQSAYVVVPVRITYRQSNKPLVENGTWTFALKKSDGAWKIAAAAFSPGATP